MGTVVLKPDGVISQTSSFGGTWNTSSHTGVDESPDSPDGSVVWMSGAGERTSTDFFKYGSTTFSLENTSTVLDDLDDTAGAHKIRAYLVWDGGDGSNTSSTLCRLNFSHGGVGGFLPFISTPKSSGIFEASFSKSDLDGSVQSLDSLAAIFSDQSRDDDSNMEGWRLDAIEVVLATIDPPPPVAPSSILGNILGED